MVTRSRVKADDGRGERHWLENGEDGLTSGNQVEVERQQS